MSTESKLGILLIGNSIKSAKVADASSSIEVFTLNLAQALGRADAGSVSILSSSVADEVVGDGFRIIPRINCLDGNREEDGVVIRLGYDPRYVVDALRIGRLLSWRVSIYVFDHHSSSLKLTGFIKRLLGTVWFAFGLQLLRFVDTILIVNPNCIPYLPEKARGRAQLTRIGTLIEETKDSRERDPRLIVYAGTINDENMLFELIEAFSRLSLGSARLVIYGDGPLGGQVAERSSQVPNCSYLGRRPRSEVNLSQQRAWLTVALRRDAKPTSDVAFPSKLTECLSSGAVTVASHNSLVEELPGISIVPDGNDVWSVFQALERGIELKEDEHRRLAAMAQDVVKSSFDWRVIALDLARGLR